MFIMKKLLVILILTLSLQSLTKADDIRDFEIEGMSIGDSLLNSYSQNQIIENIDPNVLKDTDGKFKTTGFYGLFLGGNFLDYNVLLNSPKAGQHIGIFIVELGVGITVAAVMISIFRAYAGRTRAIDDEDW